MHPSSRSEIGLGEPLVTKLSLFHASIVTTRTYIGWTTNHTAPPVSRIHHLSQDLDWVEPLVTQLPLCHASIVTIRTWIGWTASDTAPHVQRIHRHGQNLDWVNCLRHISPCATHPSLQSELGLGGPLATQLHLWRASLVTVGTWTGCTAGDTALSVPRIPRHGQNLDWVDR